jgi:hypothetical protein
MTALATTLNQRRLALTGILEWAVASLELTAQQRADIEATYHECGDHLSTGLGLVLNLGDIFPQGSMRLGTVIRPFRDITDFFDLDVVFRIALLCTTHSSSTLRRDVGVHLRTKYNGAVKPLAKGWRLDFGAEKDYYLDIIPAMDSPAGGNIIAITDGNNWRDSNPRDYAAGFELVAALSPRFEGDSIVEGVTALANNARIEPLPEHTRLKSPLQRIVQITKRHRDYYFNKKTKQAGLITPSIVVTTLLMKAYAGKVHARVYPSGFDLLLACVEDMPNHLEAWEDHAGVIHYRLSNPSLPAENLVEKWNDQRYSEAFFAWHRDFVLFLYALLSGEGDQRRLLTETLGKRAVDSAFARQTDNFGLARRHGLLSVDSNVGLALGTVGRVSPRHVIHGCR